MRSDDGQTDRFPRLGLLVVLFAIVQVQVQMGRRAREQHCTSPGATTGNSRKHAKRPRAGKKAGGYGEEFMLYCIYDEKTKKYERCGPTTKGREQDRRVQHFLERLDSRRQQQQWQQIVKTPSSRPRVMLKGMM